MSHAARDIVRGAAGLVLAAILLVALPGAVQAADETGEEVAGAAGPSRAQLERVEKPADSATFTGISGLMRVPTTGMLGEGELRATVSPAPSLTESVMPGGVSNNALTFGLTRDAEISLSLGEAHFEHDFVAHAKYRLARETARRPSVALGALDLRRTKSPIDPTYFVVAGKHFAGERVEATLGLATGEHTGVLAGLSLRPVSWLELQGEYDTDRFNYGAALHLGHRFTARAANVDVGTAYTFSYQFPLAYPRTTVKPSATADLGPPAQQGTRPCTVLVQEELVRLGLENVQVQIQPVAAVRTMCVRFDNRQYTLNDYDAVTAALPVVARLADADVTQVAVRVQERGLAASEVICSLEDYRRWARGEISTREFAGGVTVQRLPQGHPTDVMTSPTDVVNAPWGRVDLTLAPGLSTEVGSETFTLAAGWWLEPGLSVQLARGLQANVRWKYPVAGPLMRGRKDEIITDEALVAYAIRPGRRVLVQGLGGRFSDRTFQHWDGYGAEIAVPAGQHALVRLLAARLDNDELGKNNYAVADVWYQVPHSSLHVRVLGGRFLYQDEGWGVDLMRYNREVEAGFGLRHTEVDNVIEVRTTFPLSPRRQPRVPARVRPRLDDYFHYSLRSLLGVRNPLALARRTAEELAVTPNLVDSFFNRDRLSSDSFMIYLAGGK